MAQIINQNVEKLLILENIYYLLVFKRYLSLEDANNEQSIFATQLRKTKLKKSCFK